MLGLRPIGTAIAVMLLATPLLAQTAPTVPDTSALGRLPVSIIAVSRAIAVDVRPTAPELTSAQARTTSATHLPATWSYGDGSRTTATAMMIVGGAGLFAGMVVSGTTGTRITIGSGLLGLLGLWRYEK
jgi:hypothetical protein